MRLVLSSDAIQVFDAIASILFRCFLFLVVAQLVVWAAFLLAGDSIFRMYAAMIDIPRQEFSQELFSSLMLLKVLNVVLFLTPFVAIKLMLRGGSEA